MAETKSSTTKTKSTNTKTTTAKKTLNQDQKYDLSGKWKDLPTTKKWGVLSWAMAIILTVLLCIGTFITGTDMSTFVIVVGAAWGEVAAYNAVYAWKSKSENKMKITYDFVDRLADKYGIEAITPILQSIITD